MRVNAVNGITNANNAINVKDENKKGDIKQEMKAGYAEEEASPINAKLYKAMYGIQEKNADEAEQAKYTEQLSQVRAKYEMDTDDKNRETAKNRNAEGTQDNKEKTYYEQYLEYKHKYE